MLHLIHKFVSVVSGVTTQCCASWRPVETRTVISVSLTVWPQFVMQFSTVSLSPVWGERVTVRVPILTFLVLLVQVLTVCQLTDV